MKTIKLTVPPKHEVDPHDFEIELYKENKQTYMKMSFITDDDLKVVIPKINLTRFKMNRKRPYDHIITSFNYPKEDEVEVSFLIQPIYIKNEPVYMNFTKQPKTMTIEEIEEQLGHPIFIVKEKI